MFTKAKSLWEPHSLAYIMKLAMNDEPEQVSTYT